MALKFFTVAIRDSAPAEAELNAFLNSQRILAVDRKFVDLGENSFWVLCVDYLPSAGSIPGQVFGKKARIDYREILAPEDFALFVKLRDLRKQIAQAEAVPVYTIFTNDQLAEMVRLRANSKADLEKIAGVGDARIGKYGSKFLEPLQAAIIHETSRQPHSGDRKLGEPPAGGNQGPPRQAR